MLFDSHVHLDRLPAACLADAVAAAWSADVGQFLVPGINRAGWDHLLAVVNQTPGALAAPGLHPQSAHDWNDDCHRELAGYLTRPECVAVGEIGLDAVVAVPSAQQEQVLRHQLRLAIDLGKPVLLHGRRSTGRLLQILKEERIERIGGIWHAFSGSLETAHSAIRLGLALALGGPLTWPGSERAATVARALPAEWIVLETDAPWRAPHPHRQETNRPQWLPLIAERLSELRDWSPQETAAITTANVRRVLRLQKDSAP